MNWSFRLSSMFYRLTFGRVSFAMLIKLLPKLDTLSFSNCNLNKRSWNVNRFVPLMFFFGAYKSISCFFSCSYQSVFCFSSVLLFFYTALRSGMCMLLQPIFFYPRKDLICSYHVSMHICSVNSLGTLTILAEIFLLAKFYLHGLVITLVLCL